MDNAGAPLSAGPPTISADGRWLWDGMHWTARVGSSGFRSLSTQRSWAVAMLAAWIASAGLLLVADVTRINIVNAVINGTGASLTDARNSDRFVSLAALIHLAVFVLAAVAFRMWLYRAVANNHALGADELRFSPGWAVGWWFIPLANLVRPVQIVAETWRAADPDASRSTAETRSHVRASVVVIAWWLLYLLGNVVALFERWASGHSLTQLRGATELDIASLVVLSAAAGMAITIVLLLTRREGARARRLIA